MTLRQAQGRLYFGTGWLIGIWLASALNAPTEVFLAATIVPVIDFSLWRGDRRARRIWISVLFAIAGGIRYNLSIPHFDQPSLATYNNLGEVTVEGMIDADPDARDTYINLRLKTERLTLPDKSVRPIEGLLLARPTRPVPFVKKREKLTINQNGC